MDSVGSDGKILYLTAGWHRYSTRIITSVCKIPVCQLPSVIPTCGAGIPISVTLLPSIPRY